MKIQALRIESGTKWLDPIPNYWDVKRVKDLYSVVGGGTPNAQEISPDQEVPWATPTDFSDAERWLTRTARHISRKGHKSIGAPFIKSDGILISCRAPAGKVALPSNPLSFNQGCKGLTPRFMNVYREWFFYALVDQRTQIEGMAKGATFSEISGDALKRVVVQVPPINEQRGIAAWLDVQTGRIDKRIELLGKKRELLLELRRNLVAEVIASGVTGKGRKATGIPDLPQLPTGWKPAQVKRLFLFITSGSRGWAEYYADDGDLFLRIGNLTRETIELDLNDVQHVALPANAAEGKRTRIREGDMLVSITADLGSVAVAPRLDKPAYVNQHIALCRPKDTVHPRWLGYAMLSRQSKQQMMNSGYGGTKIQLSLDDVRRVWLGVPPFDEQREIAAYLDQRLDKVARQISLIDRLETLLKEQRKALIHEAVTGKIDLSYYEPPAEAA